MHPENPMTEHTSHTSASTPTADPDLFRPAPGAAPLWRMITAQAGMELRIMLRHGEQFLLTMVIPEIGRASCRERV